MPDTSQTSVKIIRNWLFSAETEKIQSGRDLISQAKKERPGAFDRELIAAFTNIRQHSEADFMDDARLKQITELCEAALSILHARGPHR